MHQNIQLNQEIEFTKVIQNISSIYEEIAGRRMYTLRDSVEQTRFFLDSIEEVLQSIKLMYAKGMGKDPKFVKNGRVCHILLSASSGLYGDLPFRIVKAFLANLDTAKAQDKREIDVLVVGKVGQYLINQQAPKLVFKGFLLDDNHPQDEAITKIANLLPEYDSVVVTYGRYQSLLSITPFSEEITGGVNLRSDKLKTKLTPLIFDPKDPVIFEPSAEAIADFFEDEIVKAVFRQKVYEMQLARYASRMVAMDNSFNNASDVMKGLKRKDHQSKVRIMNQKMQELFLGMKSIKPKDDLAGLDY